VEQGLVWFNQSIVDATQSVACAFKPNIAFYEGHGPDGLRALEHTVQYIKSAYPEIPVILDAKRGDIGSSNVGYVRAAFERIRADAITVSPYLGREALAPFLARSDRGVFVLAKTSNPGAGEFQDLRVGAEQIPLYLVVARQVATRWNDNNNCGVVAGATHPADLAAIRSVVGDMPILVPGVGAQGAAIGPAVRAGRNSSGGGLIINSSRDILYASREADYAVAAERAARRLNHEITANLI
jgi:orotidine-5'-phosphate decarboxylase